MIQHKILMNKLNQNTINPSIIGMTQNKINYYNKYKILNNLNHKILLLKIYNYYQVMVNNKLIILLELIINLLKIIGNQN